MLTLIRIHTHTLRTASGSNGNNIVNVIRDLGQPLNYVNAAGYSRDVSVSPGRSFAGITPAGVRKC